LENCVKLLPKNVIDAVHQRGGGYISKSNR